MKSNQPLRGLLARAPLASAVALALLAAPAAQAFEFQNGELTGSLDTTISYGISVRTEEADPDLIGKAHFNPALCTLNIPLGAIPPGFGRCGSTGGVPGSAAQVLAPGRFSANRDDGDLKYDQGDAFSNAIKITSELDLKYKGWGAFARATYFYDFENANRDDLTEAAKEKVGKDFRLLDAFIYHDFTLGDHKGSFRIGRQAVSWGESTFIQNGINVINPIDVSKLRVAGAELKEAYQPIDMLWGSFSFTDNLSMEALYMLEFEETEIDPSGTYFSSNDFASPGGTYVMLGFGTTPQPVNNPELYYATCGQGPSGYTNSDNYLGPLMPLACGSAVQRLPNRNARNTGQYGVAVRWFAENWGNTDFGFYFLNYHSRLPLLSGMSVNLSKYLTGTPLGLSAGFFAEYPEDIQMYGMSWNTSLPGGVAWQGEISYRPNMPLQYDDVELLFAALTPLNIGISIPALKFCSQIKPNCQSYGSNQYVQGWGRNKVTQLQMTFTKAFSSVLGAEQVALVGEIGATEVWDLPPQSELRYEGEGTDTGGGADVNSYTYVDVPGVGLVPLAALLAGQGPVGGLRNPLTTVGGFPTQFSWGYRIAARADYNAVWGSSFNLSPRIAFNHDVHGTTPGPGGNFLEGRKSGTIGLEANYQNKVVFDLSYTSFWGGGHFNQISDRDFASFTVKYSF